MLKLILFYISFSVLSFINNYIKYTKIKKYKEEYLKYWESVVTPKEDLTDELKKLREDFPKNKVEILMLLDHERLDTPHINVEQQHSYGNIKVLTVNVLDNMFMNNMSIIASVQETMDSAIGLYKYNMNNSFNPFYLIKKLLTIPSQLLRYIGVKNESYLRLSNVIFGIINFIIAVFPNDIRNYLISMFK